MESKRAKDLAEAHWNGYVGPLTAVFLAQREYTHDEVMAMCRFSYVSSHIHGHRHGVEDERNGLFRPRIGHHPPAHPYYHKDELPLSPEEVKSIADAIDPPSLCVSCHRQCEDKYKLDMCECIGYLPHEGNGEVEPVKVDEWAGKDLCRKCVNPACQAAGKKLRTDFCVNYYDEFTMGAAPARFVSPPSLCGTCIRQGCPVDCAEHTTECGEYLPQGGEVAQVEKTEFSYSFPAAEKYIGKSSVDYINKLREEIQEVEATNTMQDYAIELMDVIHVAETALRSLEKETGWDLQDMADHVVAKNRARGYYTKG